MSCEAVGCSATRKMAELAKTLTEVVVDRCCRRRMEEVSRSWRDCGDCPLQGDAKRGTRGRLGGKDTVSERHQAPVDGLLTVDRQADEIRVLVAQPTNGG